MASGRFDLPQKPRGVRAVIVFHAEIAPFKKILALEAASSASRCRGVRRLSIGKGGGCICTQHFDLTGPLHDRHPQVAAPHEASTPQQARSDIAHDSNKFWFKEFWFKGVLVQNRVLVQRVLVQRVLVQRVLVTTDPPPWDLQAPTPVRPASWALGASFTQTMGGAPKSTAGQEPPDDQTFLHATVHRASFWFKEFI